MVARGRNRLLLINLIAEGVQYASVGMDPNKPDELEDGE